MMPREKHSELSLIFCLERRNHRVKSSITRKTLNPRYCQKQKKRNIRHILLNEGINHSLTIFLFLNYYQAKLFVLSAKTKVIKPGLFTDCSTDLWKQHFRTIISNRRSFYFNIYWNEHGLGADPSLYRIYACLEDKYYAIPISLFYHMHPFFPPFIIISNPCLNMWKYNILYILYHIYSSNYILNTYYQMINQLSQITSCFLNGLKWHFA